MTDEIKVLVEDFITVFGQDHLPDHLESRLADVVKFNKIENVQKAIEHFRANPILTDDPEGVLYDYAYHLANHIPFSDVQKADVQESPAGNTQSQDEKAEKQIGFTKLSHLFTDRMRYIPPAPFKVYVLLRSYVNQKILNRDGVMKAWPSHEYICYKTGYSEHTVIEAIRCLKTLGFIEKTQTMGENGYTEYTLSDGIEDEIKFRVQVHGLKHEAVPTKQIKTEIYRDKHFKSSRSG